MSQDFQQSTGSMGQQTYGGQTGQMSQQPQSQGMQSGSAHQMTHQQVGQQFESELTPELNEALEAFDRVVEVASWCADKCIEAGPQMAECARLCLDLAEIAELNEKLISRDSINGPEVAETFLRIAQQGIPILEQHQQSPHVQDTLQTVTYAIDTTNRLLNSISGQGFQEMAQQQQQMGGQDQQMGGQSSQMGGQMGQTSQQPQGQQFQGGQPY